MNLFFRVEVYMVTNDVGHIITITITKGNLYNKEPYHVITERLEGSIYANKCYIRADLFKTLYKNRSKTLTRIKKM